MRLDPALFLEGDLAVIKIARLGSAGCEKAAETMCEAMPSWIDRTHGFLALAQIAREQGREFEDLLRRARAAADEAVEYLERIRLLKEVDEVTAVDTRHRAYIDEREADACCYGDIQVRDEPIRQHVRLESVRDGDLGRFFDKRLDARTLTALRAAAIEAIEQRPGDLVSAVAQLQTHLDRSLETQVAFILYLAVTMHRLRDRSTLATAADRPIAKTQ